VAGRGGGRVQWADSDIQLVYRLRARGTVRITARMTVPTLQSGLQGSRERLFASIRGLNEEQFRYVPVGETYAIATHLAHLLRIERIFTERAQAALHEDAPFVASTSVKNDDDPGLAQKLAVPQMIHGMLNTRRDLDALLSRCDEAALGRAIVHERIGRMTIAEIAVKMTEHEDEHAAEIAKLVRQVPATGRVIIPLTRRS
jgi:uncharacterized damage-inducible protein DinB